MRIRGVGGTCTRNGIQAFARLRFVNDQLNFIRTELDNVPPQNPPSYNTRFNPNAIVNQ